MKLGLETDENFKELYNYLNEHYTNVDKYVDNNPIMRSEHERKYGKGPYELNFEIDTQNRLYVCDSLADRIMDMIDVFKEIDTFCDITQWWFDNKTDFEIKEVSTRLDPANSVKFILASEVEPLKS